MRILLGLLLLGISGCGSAQATGGAEAQIIPGPGGFTCFGIFDDQGKVVGGNCLKN